MDTPALSGGEMRFTIPRTMMDMFVQEQRFIFKPWPGLMPIDVAMLKKPEFVQKLVNDPEFNKNFEIVIMPR